MIDREKVFVWFDLVYILFYLKDFLSFLNRNKNGNALCGNSHEIQF